MSVHTQDDLPAYGNWLFAQECRFLLGCVGIDGLPAAAYPEIAFAGRSNVGKSSLVNALTGRKTLAKTSATPGRTQQLNFFLLAETLMMVDLPGYGYAKAPEKSVQQWTRLVRSYLRGRPSLRRVLLLIDARHGALKADLDIMRLLDEAAVPYRTVLTKTDKLKAGELEKRMTELTAILAKHPAAFPEIIATSAEKGHGIEELRAVLGGLTKE